MELFRALALCCTFVGSGKTGIVMLPVEFPKLAIVSTVLKPVFFFSMK